MGDVVPVLQTCELTKRFGMVTAADAVSLTVWPGECLAIVGANGSGKTTFLNLVTGYLKPEHGRILVAGRDIGRLSPRAITRLGVARSFQIPQLYPSLTVIDNVLLAVASGSGRGRRMWGPLHDRNSEEEARTILGRFDLSGYADRAMAALPEGGRKLLDIAVSFALRPRLLLMDEPTSGVSVDDKFDVMDTLMRVLRESGITTVFVEHDVELVQRFGERVVAFGNGRIIADGKPDDVLTNPEVTRTVLGWG